MEKGSEMPGGVHLELATGAMYVHRNRTITITFKEIAQTFYLKSYDYNWGFT